MNDEKITYKGEVDEIVYYNKDNGYVVFELRLEDKDIVTCTGTIFEIYIGQMLEVSGTFTMHKSYGQQLAVTEYTKLELNTEYSIIRYLSSGIVKGVGEKKAEKIVERFGLNTFEIIEYAPERLAEIKGINLGKAQEIHDEFIVKSRMRSSIMEMQKYDISVTIATKIYEKLKDKAVHIVETNPYALIDLIPDLGFKYADDLASKLKLPPDLDARTEEGIKYVLKLGMNNGHTFVPDNIVIEKTKTLLGLKSDEGIISALSNLEKLKSIYRVKEDNEIRVYLKSLYKAEQNIINKLKEISDIEEQFRKDDEERIAEYNKICHEINCMESKEEIKLSDEQKEAIISGIMEDLLVITGGPGTGKTTITKIIVRYFEVNMKKVKLVAPTGRAAKRMSEATMHEAQTIHRLLEVNPVSVENDVQKFARNEENPIEADVVIIDEMSMVDVLIFSSLLRAIPQGAKLIILGDEKQLPSVGPGNVLRDIINSSVIKKIELTEIFRQAKTSMIIKNAHKIRDGKYPDLKIKDKDFFFTSARSEQNAVNLIKELVSTRIPKFIDCTPDEVQVLTPMKKGVLGVENLNKELQAVVNVDNNFMNLSKTIKNGNRVFKVHDKVMQIKNNYTAEWRKLNDMGFEAESGEGIFNGDVGEITNIDVFSDEITVKFEDNKVIKYSQNTLKELQHAYAITIHKSQGSEYKAVLIPAYDVPTLLANRNLLYTGITRAKQLIVLLGREDIIYRMVDNNDEQKRYSSLSSELKKAFRVN